MNGSSASNDPGSSGPARRRQSPSNHGDELILSRKRRIEFGPVAVAHSLVAANPGTLVGGSRFTLTLYRGEPQRFSWRTPGSDRIHSQFVVPGSVQIDAAGEPWWVQWPNPAPMLIVAVKPDFPVRIATDLSLGMFKIPTQIGVDDRVLQQFASLFGEELADDGAHGRLYIESLAETLTVYLLNRCAKTGMQLPPARGGLPPAPLRRVFDYIEARLDDDVGLAELAELTGLGTHHFGQAFRASTGMPPHRYLIERRIHRVKKLLLDGDLPIAEIAVAAGFSSQSHMTMNFRKLVGTTPARYRRTRTVFAVRSRISSTRSDS